MERKSYLTQSCRKPEAEPEGTELQLLLCPLGYECSLGPVTDTSLPTDDLALLAGHSVASYELFPDSILSLPFHLVV